MAHHITPDPWLAVPDPSSVTDLPASAATAFAGIADQVRQIAGAMAESATLADLRVAATRTDELVANLHGLGIGVSLITRLVCELNDGLLRRLWSLVAPPDLMRNSCLMVMGSEARAEQTLKTDQDNGMLLRDGFEFEGLVAVTESFTQALCDFGYPLCPGGIMISNARWRQGESAFKETIRHWCYDADADGVMQLAILLDARAIAGDVDLLRGAKAYLWSIVPDGDAFLARFVSPVGQFDHAGGGWWHWLSLRHEEHQQVIDLKKTGSFQIVHGVRALALKHQVDAVSTRERLLALVEHHGLPAGLARDLLDALNLLIGLRLGHHLRQRRRGRPADNLVDYRDLGTLEHAELDSATAIVKEFRKYLQLNCPFEML